MEYLFENMKNLEKLGIDLKILAENLIQNFLKQAVRDGFFHGDMHQGNLFVDQQRKYYTCRFWYYGKIR